MKTARKEFFRFYNVVPCNIGREEQQARDVIELEARTGIRIALYSLTLHPEGFPARKKADLMIESYRKFSRALKGSKVTPGVLIQSILGHWPRVDKDEEKWTRTVDLDGNTPRFCPLDKDFRAYIFETIAALAKEKPCFILGDDDIRAFSPKAECFCQLHTAEFNRRTGRHFTPEQYRLAVRDSKVGDEIFTAYERLRQDTVNGVCALIREAIDSVDPSIPAGTCMPGWESRFNGYAAQAIAGKGQPPVMRIGSGKYMERTALDLAENHLAAQAKRLFWHDIPELLDEADTCPHTLYSKAARSVHAKLCSAIFAGLNGAKIWYVNGHKGIWPVNRKYTAEQEKYRRYYPVLAETLHDAVPEGVIIPVHDRFPHWHPSDTKEYFVSAENWVRNMLGVYGIPFRCSFDLTEKGIYAVAGEDAVERFSDEQLRQLMTRKVLLDGPAAAALTRRGFAREMGVTAEMRDFKFNREVSADGKTVYPISKNPRMPFLTVTDAKAETLTNLGYAAFSCSKEIETVCPGAVLCRNDLGGVICTTAFQIDFVFSWMQDLRKVWLETLLERLNGKKLPYLAAEFQPIMLLHRKISSGEDVLGLFNLGFDPMDTLSVRCARKPAGVKFLQANGRWKTLPVRWEKGILDLSVRLECYEPAVFRIASR
ncbi:MAG: hypothetical protein IJS14_06185 [Lentisphaeria bacterium]|nr:hypothetical protein [Lentisphaeria bacterium]